MDRFAMDPQGTLDVAKKARSPFLRKLWEILMDPRFQDVVSWDLPLRQSFSIYSQAEMEQRVLPAYFKSNQFSSFQRQLNYFGFHKQGKEGFCYQLELFQANRPEDILNIKRKVNTGNLKKAKSGGKARRPSSRRQRRSHPYESCGSSETMTRPTHSKRGRAISWVNKENEYESSSEEEDEVYMAEEENVPRPTLKMIAAGKGTMEQQLAYGFPDKLNPFGCCANNSKSFYVNDPLLPLCSPLTPGVPLTDPKRAEKFLNNSSSLKPFGTPIVKMDVIRTEAVEKETKTTDRLWANAESSTPELPEQAKREPSAEPEASPPEGDAKLMAEITRLPSLTRSLSLTSNPIKAFMEGP